MFYALVCLDETSSIQFISCGNYSFSFAAQLEFEDVSQTEYCAHRMNKLLQETMTYTSHRDSFSENFDI